MIAIISDMTHIDIEKIKKEVEKEAEKIKEYSVVFEEDGDTCIIRVEDENLFAELEEYVYDNTIDYKLAEILEGILKKHGVKEPCVEVNKEEIKVDMWDSYESSCIDFYNEEEKGTDTLMCVTTYTHEWAVFLLPDNREKGWRKTEYYVPEEVAEEVIKRLKQN